MRIAYLVNQYPKVSHTFIRREIQAIEREGILVTRCSIRHSTDPMLDPSDVEEGKKTHVVLDAGVGYLLRAILRIFVRSPFRSLRAALLLLQIARRSDRSLLRHLGYLAEACALVPLFQRAGVEHVHAHFGTNSATVAMLCRVLGGPSFSFTAHGPEEFDRAWGLSLGEKITRADFVVAISSFGRSQLYRYCDSRQWAKIKLIRCGVDAAFLDPEPSPLPALCRLISIGRLCEQKGYPLLLEALGRLRQEGRRFELVLVGDGELRAEVEAAIVRHGLSEQVRIVGWADGASIRRMLDESSAMILPSFAEGLPVVLMEALARARPVLSTYVAGIPELVVPGRNGWLIPAGSVDALVVGLREVLDTPREMLTELGLRGREDVGKKHEISKIAKGLAALFLSVRGQHPSR
jgi:glycosyltransferase involved in cell wall biosynthesis